MALEWLALLRRAHHEFSTRITAVTEWSVPTPDTDWDVTDLVRHVVTEQQWVPPLLGGLTVEQAESRIRPLGEDLRREWQLHSGLAIAAWNAAPPAAPVHLSYATATVEHYLREQVSDITIHAWDLARAVGADEELDPGLVAAVWDVLDEQRDLLAASGLFATPVPIPADASPQDRLLALTGRDPRPSATGRTSGGMR
ncbi:TIGR03086 family metal-binding protein [Rhodococcus sp. NPDC058505]|uniref:TIGR03086 family metal-binding protein n=1 Tax=unclassified Rhodococcus (in: high G+C Gram-positive bacteria) TaxID=192944 RepID=UPI003663BC30